MTTITIEDARKLLSEAQERAQALAQQAAALEAEQERARAERGRVWSQGIVDTYPDTLTQANADNVAAERAFHEAVTAGDFAAMRDAWLHWGASSQQVYQVTAAFLNAAGRIGLRTWNGSALPTPAVGRFIPTFSEAVDRALTGAYTAANRERSEAMQQRIHDVLNGEGE